MDSLLFDHPKAMPTLPPECLEIIFSYLRYDLASLHRLLLVSREFFRLTVPMLYQSPFRLATGAPDPASRIISFSAAGESRSFSAPRYRTAHDSTSGWARSLERTKLLSKLLIQELKIDNLGQISRPTVHKAPIFDDWGGLENVQPLLAPVDHHFGPRRSVNWDMPSDWTSNNHWNMNLAPSEDENWGSGHARQQEECSDLINFEDNGDDVGSGSHQQHQQRTRTISNDDNTPQKRSRTDLCANYFQYYTRHDHHAIGSVIRELYPGAGRRECDKYMVEIERAILLHNPGRIESIYIQLPSVIVPHLQSNIDKFEQLAMIELNDPVWTDKDLAMVHKFLKDYSALFPAVPRSAAGEGGPYKQGIEGTTVTSMVQRGMRRRAAAIRHFKYASFRSYWDNTRLDGQLFDPVQLMKALGPGLKTIDSIYWPRTQSADLETLDVSALYSLRIWSQATPHEDLAFSRPEFLSRCRQLKSLELFSSSKDMFTWAVEDWNAHRKKNALPDNDEALHRLYPRMQPSPQPSLMMKPHIRPPVSLRHLRIHGPTDQIVYEILRDAFYGFRETLETLEARSDMEYVEGEAEWMDQAQVLLLGGATSAFRGAYHDTVGARQGQEPSPARNMDDEGCYGSLSSIARGPLLIQWSVSRLTILDLVGPIAGVFDLGSLRQMPSLHTVCFWITTQPNAWFNTRARNRPSAHCLTSDNGQGHERYDMTDLPFVTFHALKRVLIRGPWIEITDRSLQRMIDTITDHSNCGDDSDEIDGRWGNQLLEFSVLDNARVTVPTMIRLACQMDQLQVMGMSLNLPPPPDAVRPEDVYPYEYNHPLEGTNKYDLEEPFSESTEYMESDPDTIARRMIMRASLEMPWVDLGPEANHLGRRARRDGYLNRRWDL
ncbi:hypothetical protein BC939DRAFT_460748 [Gamsiella multidivaricata]|uniref:uncharacterized protein n=1 Tax=Gamsiella multidivaricata TaxID=101098 RepID=UPI002220E803|nr:uncharacterized protein BC939DRAFT_460748 [Gamsiella multidivaricata]KAG0369569.1 hypothetical protein BGZ54_009545 [Gamsiella multidivaricata]KAI7819273.1 hypothetical protein BC939DRAFT_460748 [Gamsiella multidivaricata]